MKEIKFRAWDKRNNKWIHPELFFITNSGFYTDYRALEDGNSLFDYEYDLMQYTGLKDKNSQEIYEGDIVRSISLSNDHHQMGATSVLTIKYFMGNPCLCLKGYETGIPIYPFCVSHNLEVIGNIYEHSELIQS